MDKGRVNHAIRRCCSTAQALQVFNVTAMDFDIGSRRDKGFGARIRARETEHLMTSVDQFPDDRCTNEACCTGNKNPHMLFLLRNLWFGR